VSAAGRGAAAAAGTLTGLILLIGAKAGGATLSATPVALPTGEVAAAGGARSAPPSGSRPTPTGPPAGTNQPAARSSSSSTGSGASPTGGSSNGGSPAGGSSADRVVTGPAFDVRYGLVQVQVTLRAGRIVDVSAVQLPSDRSRSRAISNYAAPILRREALAAQGAQIDSVSGASYTSDGYAQSLQAALDQARA
jgi:uncharacterized protein with FMN-binding domain